LYSQRWSLASGGTQAIIEKEELGQTSYCWLIAVLLVVGLGGLVLALAFLRRRGQASLA
jgi:hypothetical protein